MRELTLRVGAADVEEVFDAILPVLPGGVHVREQGDRAELAIVAMPGTPEAGELRRLLGHRLIELAEREVPDDWRERRLARYEPLVVADRFLVRPDWAPHGDGDLIEIVLEESSAFGTGLHPTTQACLATLAEVEPGGPFADLGCGSGVLSIAAARLGWSPVLAVDHVEPSVVAARGNAERNGVEIDVRQIDLTAEPPPSARTIVANVPPEVHEAVAGRLERAPDLAILSGFQPGNLAEVTSVWGAHGLQVVDEVRANEWSLLVMR